MVGLKTKASAKRAALIAIAAIVVLASSEAAADVTVLPGYYYVLPLPSTPSTNFSFDVNRDGKVAYVTLICGPTSPRIESKLRSEKWSNIEVQGPKLKLDKAGDFSYNGTASINGRPRSQKLGSTTLRITAEHVDGPTIHYQYQHQTDAATRYFVGIATSPACITTKIKQDPAGTPLYRDGMFQLYG